MDGSQLIIQSIHRTTHDTVIKLAKSSGALVTFLRFDLEIMESVQWFDQTVIQGEFPE